jgi:hypothetical protein
MDTIDCNIWDSDKSRLVRGTVQWSLDPEFPGRTFLGPKTTTPPDVVSTKSEQIHASFPNSTV